MPRFPSRRLRLLEGTGHRYFGWYVAIALGLIMAALVSFFRSRLRFAGNWDRPAQLGLRLTIRLLPVQIAVCLRA